jgi:hypothetical protein
MFVQVIEGKAKDAAAVQERLNGWKSELAPNAVGYLGSTGGVAEDGTFIAAARFESKEAAQKNSERPEQGAWWDGMSKNLEDVKFYDCEEVDVWGGGGSDEAGFVQVIQAYANDKEKLREVGRQMDEGEDMPDRPDVLGGFVAWGPDDGFSQFIYFTSEAEAREGEKKGGPPPEFESLIRDPRFIDLKDPWLLTP